MFGPCIFERDYIPRAWDGLDAREWKGKQRAL